MKESTREWRLFLSCLIPTVWFSGSAACMRAGQGFLDFYLVMTMMVLIGLAVWQKLTID